MDDAAVARVLIDSPLPQLDRLFDYAIPEHLRGAATAGVRVRAPLRSAGRVADGIIIEVTTRGDYTGSLTPLESVVSPIAVLTPEVWALARKAADRAAGSASDIIRLAVPKRQVRPETAFLAGGTADQAQWNPPASLAQYGDGTLERAVAENQRAAVDAVPLVREVTAGSERVWVGGWAVAMATAAAVTIAGGRSAILAVPDYRDQQQLQSALEAILPTDRLVRLDARQPTGDRYRAFLRCLRGEPLVIVGNRSVVYAPAPELGLIAIWDDGDPLHAELLTPHVHVRDAALLRQEQQNCALMFFGHTRSTEVERLVEIGWLTSISPTPRVLPKVIPTARQSSNDRLAAQARIPTSAWNVARSALETGPVLVQVARPGYAPRLACVDCGMNARCRACEGPLAQKSAHATPACTWCGALAASWLCRHCEGEKMRFVGRGSARTAEDLGRAFPGVRIIIADGEHPVGSVGFEPALVIATRGAEPIAAGGYRAVLLLDGESMIARESLRVGEDCLRWWSNAVALAAAGASSVLVGVGGTLATTLVTWRHAEFASAELRDRRELRFPPVVRVATITGTSEVVSAAVAATGLTGIDVLGPVEVQDSLVRTILRFDYSLGTHVAQVLRSELVRAATARRRKPGGGGYTPPTKLRVRFDDTEPFLEG